MGQEENRESTLEMESDVIGVEGREDNEVEANESPEVVSVITEEITELLSNDNIVEAISKFETDSEEKEIAMEFVKSHILFLQEIVEKDYNKEKSRMDVEIRDLVSHVNMMLRKRDEYLFTAIIMNSPAHYKSIEKDLINRSQEEQDEEAQ